MGDIALELEHQHLPTLMVLQNENFNYSRFTDSYLMEPWTCTDSDLSKTKDDLTAFSFLYECKTPKDQRMTACSRGSSLYKPERLASLAQVYVRTLGASSPDLLSLDSPTHIMKLLTNNISASQSQEVLDLNRKLSPLCPPKQTSPGPQTYIQPAESYDKQVINTIFDSLLHTAYPAVTTEGTVSYSDSFVNQSSPVYSDSYTNSPPERFRNDFQFILGAPQASQHKTTEMPMVYLNKGQFYPISLLGMDSSAGQPMGRVKTVIMAVFENDKSPEMQLKCWNHWHARQPTVKQRVIDIADYKETLTGISNVDEVAFNALSFVWNTNEEAKVYIGINSLSTDFSAQKGVKGLPLNLQIDTYDISTGTNTLIHRAACQIKIFCDKGAERKMRDEDRKKSKRRVKNDSSNANSKQGHVSSSMGADSTYFKTLDDHVTQPVLFIPEMHYSNLQRCGLAPSVVVEEGDSRASLKRVSCYPEAGERCSPPPSKQARQEEHQRVLLYVRKETEEVFDALMLNSPTLKGLREAISEKYGMQEDAIGKVFKKCKRGIFINMDDNIIEHYSNHSAFLINISEVMMGHFHITLTEL
ncbi:grainyhead-like protein 3 homolog [Clupea harengus]|uniref:Grainyhead-like protein 3 homolog n=1 Tax=Clupea harengus TaxID=7950 RepID=A0A6P3W872_CLUHA|nr:grainyhead-like protein 3 homolog [Clupea harengus]